MQIRYRGIEKDNTGLDGHFSIYPRLPPSLADNASQKVYTKSENSKGKLTRHDQLDNAKQS